MNGNPFSVVSPEEMTAETANQLFVEMHSDYPDIIRPGNMLVKGARGSGKSMLIRCTLPDFLMVRHNRKFSELDYLALNVSVKKTSLNLEELHKLDDRHLPYMINEHFLTLNVVMLSFLSLSKIEYEEDKYDRDAYEKFYTETYLDRLVAAGCREKPEVHYDSPAAFFRSLYKHLLRLSDNFILYLTRLFGETEQFSYQLELFSYIRFLVPVFSELVNLPGFPQGKPILLFIDDADNLSLIQTQILNTWFASRTQPTISLKVFTQIDMYKSSLTTSGKLVEAPHDYQEINISYKYTTKAQYPDYYRKAVKILVKRLKLKGYGENVDEERCPAEAERMLKEFFPGYKKQEEGIQKEAERIQEACERNGSRGYRPNDDIRRYAIPNYIRHLSGKSKNLHTYQYAGIDNIIHLSSGIIRYLLDAAAKMYDTALASGKTCFDETGKISYIPSNIQDTVLRNKADDYLFNELKKSEELDGEDPISRTEGPKSTTDKLGNLINAMGKTFHEILLSGNDGEPMSGRSERNVFSIAISDPQNISRDLQKVLKLGVRLGFLHSSYIGNKEGNGRTSLYILNRCFAPIFTLDPTGIQGYLFMTTKDLENAMEQGKRLRKIGQDTADENVGIYQMTIDDFLEES